MSDHVRFSVEREGSRITLCARAGSSGFNLELGAAAMASLALNLQGSTYTIDTDFTAEFILTGELTINKDRSAP